MSNFAQKITRSNKFATSSSLLLLLGVLMTSTMTPVRSEALHSPFRLRFNADLLKGIFHRRDQEILNVFANISLGYVEMKSDNDEQGSMVSDMEVSLVPKDGINFDDFDFNLSFDEKDFIGMESKDIRFKGIGHLRTGHGNDTKKEEFQIEGPIDDFKFEYEIGDNGTSKVVLFKGFNLDIDPSKIQITHSGDIKLLEQGSNLDQVKKTIVDELKRQVIQIKDDTMSGSLRYLQALPILNITPLIALFHTTNTAEKVHFAGDYLEYDFSPASFKIEQNEDTLKPIDHQFAPLRDEKGQRAFQLVIDENFPNAYFNQLIQYDKKLSLREMLSADPRFALFRQLLTTTTVGMAMPTFKEEYGENKNIDVIFTISNEWIQEIVDSLTPSGFSLDAKGNFKVHMNVGAQIIVERKKGQWDDSRKMLMTLALKGKIFVADAEFENRTLVILPRGIELSNLKIFKGDEEQFLEQMLAQSLIGVQLDQFKKSLKPQVFPLKDFNNPPELQCFGFNLTNVDVFVNKGYVQINSNYKQINRTDLDEIRQEFCDVFEASLKSSPEKFQDMLGHYIPGLEHLKRTEEAFQSEKELRKRMQEKENPPKQKEDKYNSFNRNIEDINLPDEVAKEIEEEEKQDASTKNKYAKYAKQNTESQTKQQTDDL